MYVCIYDSLHSLNVNLKMKKISYPFVVEQAACQLATPKSSLTMTVEDVQQQKGGDDCGFFSIAFATLLCLGKDPSKALYHPDKMRKELVRSLEDTDMERFVDHVTSKS